MNPNGQKLGDAWLVADFGETDTDGCDTISTFLPAGYMPQSDVVMPSPTPSYW